MLFRRLGAVAFGAVATIAVASGAACSHSYAEDTSADATPDASAADDAQVEAAVDADTADTFVPKPPTFVELAKGRGALTGIAATEKAVYFIEATKSTVSTVPIEGGNVTVAYTAAGVPNAFIAFGPLLFWTTPDGVVGRFSLLDQLSSVQNRPLGTVPFALAAAADQLVVLERSPVPITGALQHYDFALSATAALSGLSDPYDVALGGGTIYWTESTGRVAAGAFGASTNTEVSNAEPGCESIAGNAAGAVWTRPSDGLVRFYAVATASTGTLTAGESSPSSIAGDLTDVYWLTGDGKVRRKTIGQELPPATVASGFPSAWAGKHVRAIAVTSKYVVWITTDGRVLRADK
jgi:hypothetical protein